MLINNGTTNLISFKLAILFPYIVNITLKKIYSVGVYEEGGIDVALPLFIGNPLVLTNVIILMYLKYYYR